MNKLLCLMAILCIRVSVWHIKTINKKAVKTICIVLSWLCLAPHSYSQTSPTTGVPYVSGKIYVDSRLPDFILGNTINCANSAIKLSDFCNKIIILDFWFTSCGDCIAQFPKEDSLQRKFNSSIQIIPVAYEDKKIVEKFLDKWQRDHHTKLSMPFIVNDTLLNNCFPDPYFPHYVWLAQNWQIMAITSQFFLTAENIQGLLKETEHISKRLQNNQNTLKNDHHLDIKYLYHPIP